MGQFTIDLPKQVAYMDEYVDYDMLFPTYGNAKYVFGVLCQVKGTNRRAIRRMEYGDYRNARTDRRNRGRKDKK